IGATSEIPAYPNAPGERRCNPSAKLGRRCKKCQKEFRCQVLGEKSQTPYEILQSFPPQTSTDVQGGGTNPMRHPPGGPTSPVRSGSRRGARTSAVDGWSRPRHVSRVEMRSVDRVLRTQSADRRVFDATVAARRPRRRARCLFLILR